MGAGHCASTLAQLEAHPAFPTSVAALRSVLAGSGGAVAADNDVARALLGGGEHTSAEPMLRRIRMIKSVHEVSLMRAGRPDQLRSCAGGTRLGEGR